MSKRHTPSVVSRMLKATGYTKEEWSPSMSMTIGNIRNQRIINKIRNGKARVLTDTIIKNTSKRVIEQ